MALTNVGCFRCHALPVTSRLSTAVALITGGDTGVGLATARSLALAGATVYITGYRRSLLDQAVKAIGGNVRAIVADTSEPDDLDHVLATIEAECGRLDVLLAHAFIATLRADSVAEEQFREAFDVHLKGMVLSVQKAITLMTTGGIIVLLVRGEAGEGHPTPGIAAAATAAMRSLVQTWTVDLRGRSIEVHAIDRDVPSQVVKLVDALVCSRPPS